MLFLEVVLVIGKDLAIKMFFLAFQSLDTYYIKI